MCDTNKLMPLDQYETINFIFSSSSFGFPIRDRHSGFYINREFHRPVNISKLSDSEKNVSVKPANVNVIVKCHRNVCFHAESEICQALFLRKSHFMDSFLTIQLNGVLRIKLF